MHDLEDFLKRKLAVGDYVIMLNPHGKQLLLAKIEKFTINNSQCYVRWKPGEYGVMRQRGEQLVKVEGPDLMLFFLKRD